MSDLSKVVGSEVRHVLVHVNATRHLARRWMRHARLGEFSLLSFILDQTLCCGVYERLFTYRFMEHGDWDTGPAETRTRGIGLSKRQLIRLVASLEAIRLINVDRSDTSEGLLISINIYGNAEQGVEPMDRVIEAFEHDARVSGICPWTAMNVDVPPIYSKQAFEVSAPNALH